MKLIACHIENFGKLSNLSIDFYDGINVISESNAWGKSTLAAFLKAMFYGLDAKKNAGDFEKERVLYRPWQGGTYGGELDFEVGGKRYRISRSFGATEKTDQFHLYDLSTFLESFDYSQNIGEELFDLDSASFKRSIYIAQNDCLADVSDGISAKLGNLAENTNDINNFEDANRRLKELLNQLTPDRVTGSIKKRKNYMTQLTQELCSFDAAQDGLDGIKRKEHLVSEQIEELLAIRKNYADALVVASEESRKKELYAQYDNLCQDVNEKEEKLKVFEQIFAKGVPGTQQFKEQMQNARQMENTKSASKSYELTLEEYEIQNQLETMFDKEVPTDEDIDSALSMFDEIDRQKEEIARQESKLTVYETMLNAEPEEPKYEGVIHHKSLIGIGFGVAFVGGGALFAWYFNLLSMIEPELLVIAGLVALICGAMIGFVGTFTGVSVKKKQLAWKASVDAQRMEINEKYETLNRIISSMKGDVRNVYATIGSFLGKFHIFCEVGEYQSKLYELKNQLQEYNRLVKKAEYCQELKENYLTLKSVVQEFANQYGFALEGDYSIQLNELENKAVEYQIANQMRKEAVEKKEVFEKAQEKSFWTRQAMCPYSIDELNLMIAKADDKLEELKSAKVQYTKQLEDLQEQLDLRDEKQAELDELQQLQEADIKKYHVIKQTQEFLQRAKEQFTAKYMNPIANGFAKYYQMLTGTKGNWVIDANINLKVHEQGELRDTRWLSAGYQDLIGVCMRLALVDAMYEDEKPFLILDDPFVNLDEEKVQEGNKLLLSVAEEYQVIYFTCHDSRNPIV